MNGWPGTAETSNLAKLAAMDERHREAASLRAKIPAEPLPAPASEAGEEESAAPDFRQWTKAICKGDELAFTRFYDIYSLRLYRYLLVLGKGNEAEAREVLQTIVIKLARQFRVFDDERQMWRWLCRLSQNAYVDLWRSQRRTQRLVSLDENAHDPEIDERSAEEHQLATGLHYVLAQLEEADQELMRSVYVDRRPLQELADATGQTYKAVESRLGRLRQKLKANLLKYLRHENR
jgi:RNA polymerase sigma factor, sigma-70 family